MSTQPYSAGWEAVEELVEATDFSGAFLTLPDDKDRAIIAFMGAPLAFQQYFVKERQEGDDPAIVGTPAGDAFKAQNPKARPGLKVRFPVFVLAFIPGSDAKARAKKVLEDKWKAGVPDDAETQHRCYEVNRATYKSICQLRDRKPFATYLFEVVRDGKKGDTKTTYNLFDIAEQSEFSGLIEHMKNCEPVNLQDPTENDKPDGDGKSSASSTSSTSSSATITAEQADEIKSLLKPNKDATKKWCAKYVRQIKKLPASNFVAALAYAKELTGSADEEDPFA